MLRLEEAQSELEGMVAEAAQLRTDADAFDRPAPP
jgi:hypothetical protein